MDLQPLVTTDTRTLCCSAVSERNGPFPSGATGTPIGCCWAMATPTGRIASKPARECLSMPCCMARKLSLAAPPRNQ